MQKEKAPLGLYIHIPFCKSKCDYCDFYSLAGREEEMDHYQKALIAQLRSFAPRLKGRVADTIYFGGGTPSYYGEKRLRELLVLIQRSLPSAARRRSPWSATPTAWTGAPSPACAGRG